MLTETPPPGCALRVTRFNPGAFPSSIWLTDVDAMGLSWSAVTVVTAPLTLRASWVPYPIATTVSSATACVRSPKSRCTVWPSVT